MESPRWVGAASSTSPVSATDVRPVLILDTNVYLDADRDEELASRLSGYLAAESDAIGVSSVVVAELLIGIASPSERARLVQRTLGAVDTVNVLTPTHADWLTAGEALNALGGSDATRGRSFWNDLLIAASCARIRATLLTRNTSDFQRIRRAIPVMIRTRPR